MEPTRKQYERIAANERYQQFTGGLFDAGCRRQWACVIDKDADWALECWNTPRGIVIAQVWCGKQGGGFSLYVDAAPVKVADCIAWVLRKEPQPT